MTVLLALASFALAQNAIQTVTVRFDAEGERKAWIQSDEHADQPGDLIDADAKQLEIASTADPNGKSIFVHDLKTNKVAKKSLVPALKEGTWTPKPEEFTLTYRAVVTVGNAAGPLESGILNIKTGSTTRTVLVSPEDNGEVTVYLLPGKQAEVTLTTKVEGIETTTDPQILDLTASPDIPSLLVLAPAGAPVIKSGADPFPQEGEVVAGDPSSGPPDQTAPRQGSPLQTFFNMLVALALIGGLGYGAWWYYQNNQTKVEEIAKKAGLDPSDRQADPTGGLPPAPAQPDPVKPIVLDNANVQPGSTVPITPAGVTPAPKLVSSTGETFTLSEGQTTVGRENATVTVSESSLSRKHAELNRTGTTVTLTDLGSTNGTYVNGIKIQSSTVLNPGDTVQFGAAQFTYQE